MGYYIYYDRDYFQNNGDFPLNGEHYQCLLRHCFRYGAYVSFLVRGADSFFLEVMDKWRLDREDVKLERAYQADQRIAYYACDELYQFVTTWVYDLFEMNSYGFYAYPEDPVFFRNDGSIFFDSIIHEGECSLYPREDENISEVLAYGHWLYVNDRGVVEVPAKEHQFPLPELGEVQADQLYKELLIIKQDPSSFLSEMTVDAICTYLNEYRPPFLRKARNLPGGISCFPNWYYAFNMYMLGELDALTGADVSAVLAQKGYSGAEGYHKFFEFLSRYISLMGE